MYNIVGTKNCGKCNQLKQLLDNKKIEHKYCLFDDLTYNKKEEVLEIAKNNSIQSFPLIFDEIYNFIKYDDFLENLSKKEIY